VKGKGVAPESDPYLAARRYAGHFGKIQNRLDDLSERLTPARGLEKQTKEYAQLERYEELAGRGIDKFPGGETIDQVRARKAALEQELGPEKLAQVNQAVDGIREWSDGLLQEARDAGVISQASYDGIKAKNEKYIPLQRLEYLEDQLDELPHGGNSFSVANQDFVRSIKGSEKAVVDPFEGLVRNAYKAVSLIERNRVAQDMAALAEKPGFEGQIIKARPSAEPPPGMGKFSVLVDGQKHDYLAPKPVVEAMKGMTRQNADMVTKWAAVSANMLRQGSTGLYAPFIPTNAVRDFASATLVSRVGFNPADWVRGFASYIAKDQSYHDFLESGGSFSGYFERNKRLTSTANELTRSKGAKVLRTVTNPIELIRVVGESVETAPRLGVFKRSRRMGHPAEMAAMDARDATVDFAKSGSVGQLVNLWVPFLNARTQGTANVFRAFGRNPKRAMLVSAAIIGAPAVATYLNNTRQYKDVWDDIAQFEKDNNWLVVYGRQRDAKGNPKQVVKIRKDEAAKALGNTLEAFLSYLDGQGTKTLDTLALQLASNLSPVGFEQNGKLAPGEFASGIAPPLAKVLFEEVSNRNFYTDRPIVPDQLKNASPYNQYDKNTPEWLKSIGKTFNLSPLRIQHVVTTQFGGLGRTAVTSKSPDPLSFTGQMAADTASRFSGARGGEQEQRGHQMLDQLQQQDTDKKLDLKRSVEQIHADLMATPEKQRGAKVEQLIQSGKLNEESAKMLVDLAEAQAKGLTNLERRLKSSSVEVRAKYMLQSLEGKPPQDADRLMQTWIDHGLLNENVAEHLIALKEGTAQPKPAKKAWEIAVP
jgi:hypothetical protein